MGTGSTTAAGDGLEAATPEEPARASVFDGVGVRVQNQGPQGGGPAGALPLLSPASPCLTSPPRAGKLILPSRKKPQAASPASRDPGGAMSSCFCGILPAAPPKCLQTWNEPGASRTVWEPPTGRPRKASPGPRCRTLPLEASGGGCCCLPERCCPRPIGSLLARPFCRSRCAGPRRRRPPKEPCPALFPQDLHSFLSLSRDLRKALELSGTIEIKGDSCQDSHHPQSHHLSPAWPRTPSTASAGKENLLGFFPPWYLQLAWGEGAGGSHHPLSHFARINP